MRALLVVVLFVSLAAGAWFVFERTDVAPPANTTAAPLKTADASAAAALLSTALPRPGSETPIPAAAVEADANQREAATPVITGPSGDVQVVRFDTRAPIPGATVHCSPPDFYWPKLTPELQALARADNDALLKRVGLAFTTDANGCCRVPVGESGAQVLATKDELRGQGYVRADAAERVVVALRADHTLHVRVLDAGGRPAPGATVLGKRTGGKNPMSRQMGQTDAEGRFDKRHIQEFASEDAEAKIEFAASMPGCESPPISVDVTAPPAEVLLHLPPAGSVTVRVLDAEGKPIDPTYLGEPGVKLATFAEKPTDQITVRNGMNRTQHSVLLDAHGEAEFGTVGLDQFVMASVGWSTSSAVVPGPTLATPRVEIILRESADDVVLAGTLVDADGRPMATSQYVVQCKYKNGSGGMNGRTDASGRFRLALAGLPAGQAMAVSFDTRFGNEADPMAIELPSRQLTKGRNDLGEVRLERHSLLVEGKVVMADGGEPVPVQIQVERGGDANWGQDVNIHPVWGKEGTFTMRGGIAKGTPIKLVVRSNDCLPVPPIECAAGDKGIEIKLLKGGSARATFLVDGTMPLERLTFRFQRTDVPPERDRRAELMERMNMMPGNAQPKDGRVEREWKGLKAGRYRLQALCAGVAEPFVAIDAIEVADGPCADPRLVDIDLRGRIRSFEIRATASDGSAIADRDAFVVIRSSGDDWRGFNLMAGVVKIAAPAAVDLIVIAKAHKVAFVSGVFDSRTIALEAAAEARLALTLPSPLPEGATLNLLLKPALELSRRAHVQLDTGRGMPAESFFVEEAIVDAAGKATVPVRFSGSCTLEARLHFGQGGGTYIRDFEPRTITLPATSEVTVKVGQKGFDRALEAARR